jgi:hypothetical protein
MVIKCDVRMGIIGEVKTCQFAQKRKITIVNR